MNPFSTIEEAIDDIRCGKMVIVVDDEDRENEGDLIMAAERVTPEAINFMVRHAGGLICMPVTRQRMEELHLDMMVQKSSDPRNTAFSVSIDAIESTTGISTFERANTILKAIDPATTPKDLTRPGHIFPLMAQDHGVLRRAGHTEAAVDLAYLAGLYPAGVICEILNEDGSMARTPQLIQYAQQHDLKMITIEELIHYRKSREKLIERVTETILPTKYGNFKLIGYVDRVTGEHHVALVKGEIAGDEPVLCRVHSECLTGDAFGSTRCDCGDQLAEALKRIEAEGRGVVVYLRQEGRGIGLINKIKAYKLQDEGMDTVEANLALGFKADQRDYGVGAEILSDLGARKIRVMTNNPLKLSGLKGYDIEIVGREPIVVGFCKENERYMHTKCSKMGHTY